MISKAKILFYGLFRRPKAPITKVKNLGFVNKLMLWQVRRFKKYRDIPPTLSIYDWQESKRRAWKHYRFIGYCLLIYAIIDVIWFFKYRRLLIAEKLYEERRKKNLPDHPPYDIFGKNPLYEAYETEFLLERRDARNSRV